MDWVKRDIIPDRLNIYPKRYVKYPFRRTMLVSLIGWIEKKENRRKM